MSNTHFSPSFVPPSCRGLTQIFCVSLMATQVVPSGQGKVPAAPQSWVQKLAQMNVPQS